LVLTAVGSFALGGYIAGRIRSTWQTNPDEVHFRDGLHGLVVWSIAVIIGAGLTWASAATINASTSKSSPVNPANSTVNTSDSEPGFLTFELDRLFWSDNRQQATDATAELTIPRQRHGQFGGAALTNSEKGKAAQLN
jgi:hypothetical protein